MRTEVFGGKRGGKMKKKKKERKCKDLGVMEDGRSDMNPDII